MARRKLAVARLLQTAERPPERYAVTQVLLSQRGGGSAIVSEDVTQGLDHALPPPDEAQTPDRLQQLMALLIERDALGRAVEPDGARPVDPTRLVLVPDDDPVMRELAVALLEETVLDVVVCETGDHAVPPLQGTSR